MTKGKKNILLGLACAVSFIVIGTVSYQLVNQEDPVEIEIGGPFQLISHTGEAVTDKSFSGRYMLMYFGFTNCPATCPAALLQMTSILNRLEEADAKRAGQVTPVFVSVDPDRDTPQVIGTYISHFHERFEGLTGTQEQLTDLVNAYGSYYSYASTGDRTDDYTVNHSSFLYLIGPNGKYVTHFTPGESSDQIIESIAKELKIS